MAKINSLEQSLDKERELREKGEIKASELTKDLEKTKEELELLSLNLNAGEEEVALLKKENEKLKSDNTALADENAQLQND